MTYHENMFNNIKIAKAWTFIYFKAFVKMWEKLFTVGSYAPCHLDFGILRFRIKLFAFHSSISINIMEWFRATDESLLPETIV